MDVLRTPDDQFINLPNWDFTPNYIDDLAGYENLRVHFIDEGPKNAERVFLCLHGQPTWSYLYRKMIPEFVASGARVIAPDWLGFGRSDKPVSDVTYGFNFHRNMMIAFVQALNLRNITLVVQDWGGLLGLTLPQEFPNRVSRLLVMNTTIAIGTPAGKGFNDWRAYNKANPDMNIAGLMARSTPILSKAEIAAYGAPFPDVTYKAGVRRFPDMVMTSTEMEGVDVSKQAVNFYQSDWQGDSFMAIGMQDPVLGPPIMNWLKGVINKCPEPLTVAEAGHFVQEWGGPIATAAMKHWGDI
jgi:pimeloyl-ACP methyl ester carboxylesterase